jgi:hypothetical protein
MGRLTRIGRSRRYGGSRRPAALLVALLLLNSSPMAVAAADVATFGTPTAKGSFGEDIVFTQPVTLDQPIGRAELLVTFADAIGPTVIDATAPDGTGPQVLSYTMKIADQGHLLPNTPLQASWRIARTGDPKATVTGPSTSLRYADKRFDWRTKTGKIVRVHWYEGNDDFGQRALEIGERGVEKAAALLGVTETEPVDFYIYASQEPFYDALGPGTRENVGGQADAEIRTLFALIPPSEIDDSWVEAVIPHELTHLVFDTAVHNAYHFPPRWLNEGLAVYESEGFGPQDRSDVQAAASDGEIIPLTGLVGQFPTTGDRFRLAYSESVSAIDYLVRTFGQDALVALITSYKDGRTDDEAFQAAIGQTMTAFSDAWLADNDAEIPSKIGPQPPPPGPVPAAWATGSGAIPGATVAPGAGGVVGATAPPANAPAGPESSSNGSGFIVLLFLIGAVMIVVAIVIARRRRDAAL